MYNFCCVVCSLAWLLACSLVCFVFCFIRALGGLAPRNGYSHCIGPKKQATLQMVDLGVCTGLFACSFVCLLVYLRVCACVFLFGFVLLACLFRPTQCQAFASGQKKQAPLQMADIESLCFFVCLFVCLFV